MPKKHTWTNVTPLGLLNTELDSLFLGGGTVLVMDLTPQLGGNLDQNGFIITPFESTGIDDDAVGTVITITSGGRVGINEISPAATLEVNDTAELLGLFQRTDAGAVAVRLQGTTQSWNIHHDNNVRFAIEDVTAGTEPFKIEEGTPSNTLYVDSNGRVGINTFAPSQALTVSGNIALTGTVDGRDVATDGTKLDGIEAAADVTDAVNVLVALAVPGAHVVLNETGLSRDLRVEGNTDTHLLHIYGAGDAVAIGKNMAGVGTPAKLNVSQSLGFPVLDLQQLDVDDSFINFSGTSASDGSKSISSDTTEDAAKVGAVRCEINGVLVWVRFYADES